MKYHPSPKENLSGKLDDGKLETMNMINERFWHTVLAVHASNPYRVTHMSAVQAVLNAEWFLAEGVSEVIQKQHGHIKIFA